MGRFLVSYHNIPRLPVPPLLSHQFTAWFQGPRGNNSVMELMVLLSTTLDDRKVIK